MMRSAVVWVMFGLAPLALCSGCGSSDSSAENTAGKTPPQSAFPKLGEPLPPLDDDRLVIAPPAKWDRLSRSSNYLAAFAHDKRDPYPKIIVTVEDFEPVHNASADNLDDYVKHVNADLKDEAQRKKDAGKGDGKVKLMEQVEATSFGKFHGVKYARRVKTSEGDVFDQYYVETVKKGRQVHSRTPRFGQHGGPLEALSLCGRGRHGIPQGRGVGREAGQTCRGDQARSEARRAQTGRAAQAGDETGNKTGAEARAKAGRQT